MARDLLYISVPIFGFLLVGFLIYELDVKLPLVVIVAILLMVIGVVFTAVISYVLKEMQVKSGESVMERAEKYAIEWWEKNRQETLTPIFGGGTEKHFPGSDLTHYGFVFTRNNPGRQLQYLTIVVKTTPRGKMDIADWNDNPSEELINDPFLRLASWMKGAPIEKPDVEKEPRDYGYAPSKRIITTKKKRPPDFGQVKSLEPQVYEEEEYEEKVS